jgi:hypothetical protein
MRESKEETIERFLLLNFFATNKQKSWPVAAKNFGQRKSFLLHS